MQPLAVHLIQRVGMQVGEAQGKSARKAGADPQAPEASQLEYRICQEGSPFAALKVAELPDYDVRQDEALGFVPKRLLAVPLHSDTGEPLAVLTLLRGYQVDDPPKREWGDARLTPFSLCDPFDDNLGPTSADPIWDRRYWSGNVCKPCC
jgi:hypothetical protein